MFKECVMAINSFDFTDQPQAGGDPPVPAGDSNARTGCVQSAGMIEDARQAGKGMTGVGETDLIDGNTAGFAAARGLSLNAAMASLRHDRRASPRSTGADARRTLVVMPPDQGTQHFAASDGAAAQFRLIEVSPLALASTVERQLRDHAPHVLLIDVARCAALDRAGALALHAVRPACRWLIGWPGYAPRWLGTLLLCDALGAVEWGCSAGSLERALNAVSTGDLWFPRMVLQRLYELARGMPREIDLDNPEADPLTPRELEVLMLVRAGLSNKQIAQRLGTSVNTVKKHVEHLFAKLGVHKRRQMSA